MKLTIASVAILSLAVFTAGCEQVADEDRLKQMIPNAVPTTPVSGQVLVDALPMKNLWVKLHSATPQPDGVEPKAQTDDEGNFKITTHIGGDGAPVGEYKITIEWLTYQQFGSSWVGPSKLDGTCGDPNTTEFTVTVGQEPVILPAFNVSARKDADTMEIKNNRRDEKRKP